MEELTIDCKYCNKPTQIPRNQREAIFCTVDCQNKYKRVDGKSNSLCVSCNKEFSHYGEQIVCGDECLASYIQSKLDIRDLPHYDSYFFRTILNALSSKSKIVHKGWGGEIHFANHESYCLKYLFFLKGKKFSNHSHNLKKELFLVTCGVFNCKLQGDGWQDEFILNTGDKLEIQPGTNHQLFALENSIIIEVSTRDFPEDSIRIEKGD